MQGALADVASAVGVFKLHAACKAVGFPDGVCQRTGHGGGSGDPAAGGQKLPIFQLRPRHIGVGGGFRGHGDLEALFVADGIPGGGGDDAAGVFIGEANLRVRQRSVGCRLHDGQQVAFQQRQHHLRLRVAEAAVVLNDLGAIGGEHQAEVKAAPEGAVFAVHGGDGGQENFLHAPLGNGRGVVGVGGNGAHAAGVQAGVAVSCPLVIHGGHHGLDHLAVGEGQHGDLRAGEKFLNDHMVAGLAEDVIFHHIPDGGLGLVPGLGDDNALAQRKTIGLDDGGDGGGVQIGKGGGHVVEDLIPGGGDAVLFHEILGKDLAALNDGGPGAGAKAGDFSRFQRVHAAQYQRVVGRDHGVIYLLLLREGDDLVNFRSADGDAHRVRRDAAVAGESENFRDLGILFQAFDDGVFPSAAAYD